MKVASICALLIFKRSHGPAMGPSQFIVETKGGCDHVKWALHMAMESNGWLSAACLDAIKALEEIECECIHAALLANPSLYVLLPTFEMLYERGSGELWY